MLFPNEDEKNFTHPDKIKYPMEAEYSNMMQMRTSYSEHAIVKKFNNETKKILNEQHRASIVEAQLEFLKTVEKYTVMGYEFNSDFISEVISRLDTLQEPFNKNLNTTT